jgi:hypothetical protein
MAEEWGKLRFRSPLRCLDCETRFVAQTFKLSDLRYARCPVCHRMDLNGWSGKTYTSTSLWVQLKVLLGARRFRCEYCRLNFASFGRRKEAFTFKRWRRYGTPAEAPQQTEAKESGTETGTAAAKSASAGGAS